MGWSTTLARFVTRQGGGALPSLLWFLSSEPSKVFPYTILPGPKQINVQAYRSSATLSFLSTLLCWSLHCFVQAWIHLDQSCEKLDILVLSLKAKKNIKFHFRTWWEEERRPHMGWGRCMLLNEPVNAIYVAQHLRVWMKIAVSADSKIQSCRGCCSVIVFYPKIIWENPKTQNIIKCKKTIFFSQ